MMLRQVYVEAEQSLLKVLILKFSSKHIYDLIQIHVLNLIF